MAELRKGIPTTEALSGADLARLLREVSHEIRSPLGTVGIWLRLLQDTTDPNERAHALEKVTDSFEQLTRITDELSDCALLLDGRLELQRMSSDLEALLSLAVERVRPAAARRGVSVDLQVPSGPVRVEGDRDRLVRVLGALLHHAATVTPPERPLTVRLEAAGGEARIETPMLDAGWRSLRRLIDLLQQQGERVPVPGLTLPLALEVLALHDGRVERSNAMGEPVMRIVLPLA